MEVKNDKDCSHCKKTFNISYFQGVKGETKMCSVCREKNKIRDANRDKEHRNALARLAERKPERIAKKKEWEEKNYDKVSKKWMDYRQRKINNNLDEYLKINAERVKKWRENNPEKTKIINENKKNSIAENYKIYQRSANYKNLEFSIGQEVFESLVMKPCYYCGIIQDKGFNGIDRTNQSIGYIQDNCVSCCKMCNYLKGSLNDKTFVNRVEHILNYSKIIEGKCFPELFSNHIGSSYNTYINRAKNKNIEWSLTKEQFIEITNKVCYLCGKKTDNNHKNGIDRIDNNQGYVAENVKPCCGECNYMKKNYNIDELFVKFKMIYDNFNKKSDFIEKINEITDGVDNKIIVKINKKTKQQINEEGVIRTKIRKEELVKRYNDEEYKKSKCEENYKNRNL
jgi:hypothetical protein